MVLKWPTKDTDEVLDYTVDWTARLAGDTIATSTYFVPAGTLVEAFDTFDDSTTTIWLTGGTDGEVFDILNRITTTGGRTYDQTVRLKCKPR